MKDPDLVQVNVRLNKADVEAIKNLATKDKRSYHALIRELLAEAVARRKRTVVR